MSTVFGRDSGECSPSEAFELNGELLKKSLLQFSKRYQHRFSKAVKVDLRRVLFFAASHQGKYMKHLFKDVDGSVLPTNWEHVLLPERYQHLEGRGFYFQRAHYHDSSHPNRSCGRMFKKGEPIYRCMTCGKDESSGLCLDCFVEEDHQGHAIIPLICQRENGGVCDCGDSDAWKRDFHCKHAICEETPISQIPEDFQISLLQTFEIVLDFVVDVLAGSTPILNQSRKTDTNTVLLNKHFSVFQQNKYHGTDWPSETFSLVLYNEQNKQIVDALQKIVLTTDKADDFGLMVTDRVNKVGRATVMTHTDLEKLIEAQNELRAAGLPCCIRNSRDTFREEMSSEIIIWLLEMVNGPVFGNYNISRDLLSRAFCRKWDVGINLQMGTPPGPGGFRDFTKIPLWGNLPLNPDDAYQDHWSRPTNPWNVEESVAKECQYDPNFRIWNYTTFHGSRLQYLLYFDIRLWKAIRTDIHKLMNSVLTSNRHYRPIVCCQYVDIYPKLLEMFFQMDREPEYSCMTTLTTQVFTSSSNATQIAQHGDLTVLLSCAYCYLTTLQIVWPMVKVVHEDLKLAAFRNRRIGQVIFDICCVLTKSTSLVDVINSDFVMQVCDILELFQGKPVLKRAIHAHVEYETNDYGLYFNMYSVTASLAEVVAKAMLKLPHDEVMHLVYIITERTIMCQRSISRVEPNHEKIENSVLKTTVMDTIEGPFSVFDSKPHLSRVSLVHPLHAFTTWAIQFSGVTDIRDFELMLQPRGDDILFHLLEYPLRTLVILAQIRVGLWVRNGYSIRTQLNIYKTSGLRESAFKRDVYMIQFLMCMLPASEIMATFINKWSLQPWLNEDFTNEEDYEDSTLSLMAEEFLLFCIQLLCDTGYLFEVEDMSEKRIRREIIHYLCFQQLSYSKLCASIPEYMYHEKRFDLVLESVADYSPPIGANGVGHYKLKDELYDEIDPYYVHYSANKRDEAEKVLRKRMSKEKGIPYDETFIEPKLQNLEGTLFENLFTVTSSRIFVQFLKSTLKFVNREGLETTESIMTLVLHLIHVGVNGIHRSTCLTFCETLFSELTVEHNEPFYYESVGALLYKFLLDESYLSHYAKIREIFRALADKNIHVNDYLEEQVEHFDSSLLTKNAVDVSNGETEFERKKRLAKERRNKLMANFKKRQNNFVSKNSNDNNLSDEDMTQSDNDDCWEYPQEHCILCQMSLGNDSLFGIACNISPSSVERTIPFNDKFWLLRSFDDVGSMDDTSQLESDPRLTTYLSDQKRTAVIGPPFPVNGQESIKSDLLATSCGHGMHYSCYLEHLESSKSRHTQIIRTIPEDFENWEYVCPLCKSLENAFIPVLWTKNRNKFNDFVNSKESWYEGFDDIRKTSCCEPSSLTDFAAYMLNCLDESLKQEYKGLLKAGSEDLPKNFKIVTSAIISRIDSVSPIHSMDHLTRLVRDTIRISEISCRSMSTPSGLVPDLVSNQIMTNLRVLVEFRKTMLGLGIIQEEVEGKRKGMPVKLAEEALGKLTFLSSDRVFDAFDDIDFFDFIFSCTPYRDVSQNSLYRLGFMFEIMQKISTLLSQIKDSNFDKDGDDIGLCDIPLLKTNEDSEANLMTLARAFRDNHPLFDNISDEIFETSEFAITLYTMLNRCITPYLRRVSILAAATCGDYNICSSNLCIEEGLESDRLCKLLNLPTLSEMLMLFNNPHSVEREKFTSYIRYISTTENELSAPTIDYPGVIRLLDLPHRLDDIYTKLFYSKEEYLSLGPSFDPAICLFCGSVVSLQKKSAKHLEGECNNHVKRECINQSGIFFLPKHNSLLLLNRDCGSFHSAPYVDFHGENDVEGKVPHLMTLNNEKYDNITRTLWMQQDSQNYITRMLEGALDVGGWETL
ncbi:UBR2 [Cyberlindnera jadinii]|uniref:E3 ubiquitin-protein ligase n=1 Tax=Cyberlindnera jadinii (strain ATCC 18201 / CBS 1600 / BCRC 20928 / JCM 3617 / NBRC 0987 / NRRL Y-1542) TaxID=983966 RepID=A0A0H5C3U8_CYBJN|nr:UBR2 [Cyberlindnera jadinii]